MKRAFVLMAVTGVNIVSIFIYQWYVILKFGAGTQSDALFASMVLPQLLLNVISGSLAYVLIPMLATADHERFQTNASNFFTALAVIFCFAGFLLFAAADYWVPLTVPGFSESSRDLTVSLAKIQLLGMVCTGIGAVPTAAYQARHKFVYPAISAAISSILALIFLFVMLPYGGIHAAAWGMAMRTVFQLIFQIPVLFPLRRPVWRDPSFRQALAKLRPLILGTTYFKTDQLVDRLLVSMAPAGVLSLLHLSQQMYSAANQVVVTALAAPVVPVLAGYARENDWRAFERKMMRSLGILVAAGALIFAIIVFPGYYVFDLVFGRGRIAESEVRQLWLIMIALGGFWFAGLTGQILSTSFFAMSDTATPTKVGAVGFTLGIFLKVGGFLWIGVWGIALGTGLYMTFNSLVMYRILRARLGRTSSPVVDERSGK